MWQRFWLTHPFAMIQIVVNWQLTEIRVNSYPYCWGGVFSKSPNYMYIYKTLITFAYLCITSEHFSGAWKPAEMCRFQSTPLGANMWADSAFSVLVVPNRKPPPGGTPMSCVSNVPSKLNFSNANEPCHWIQLKFLYSESFSQTH